MKARFNPEKGRKIMSFKEFMNMYDNWNGVTKVNDNVLNTIVEGNTYDILCHRSDLYNKEVVAFGFYDGELTVRVK